MKYIKILRTAAASFAVSLCLCATGCTDWLTVNPKDQILEKQAFSTEQAIQSTLNGLYLTMGKNSLYGFTMTQYIPELLAQQYAINDNMGTVLPVRYFLSRYEYTDKKSKDAIASLWSNIYNLILDANFFIDRLDKTSGVVSTERKNLMLGEAYAIRAYAHLDALRLFGPVYTEDGANKESIPYYTEPTSDWQPFETASDVMDKIVEDIDRASGLLQNDPVRTEGVRVDSAYEGDFWAYRNRRLNYYAVQALKVRALMYKGDKDGAASIARGLLSGDEVTGVFPWVTQEEVYDYDEPDRIFSGEVMFGIHASGMYESWTDWFSSGITNSNSLLAKSAVTTTFMLSGAFAENSPDYRRSNWTPYKDNNYMCALKFERVEDSADQLYFQPLIRKTELYYALAEAGNDTDWIDEVRVNRGLKTLVEAGVSDDLDTILHREYMSEFFGEGQLFFYYKRLNKSTIPNGYNLNELRQIEMNDSRYVLPIPEAEIEK